MGCNCKKDRNSTGVNDSPNDSPFDSYKNKPLLARLGLLVVKIFIFIFAAIVTSIIVVPFSIYMLFNVIFFDEGLDFTNNLIAIGKMLKKKDDDDDDDDYDEDFEFEDEDEIILMNAD